MNICIWILLAIIDLVGMITSVSVVVINQTANYTSKRKNIIGIICMFIFTILGIFIFY